MTEITQEIGLKAQYQVTRLLKLKEFRADIGQTLLKQLLTLISEMTHSYTNPDLLLQQEQQIQAALDEQITTLLQDAATDASTAKQHTAGSLFAQRLCHYLQQLKTP